MKLEKIDLATTEKDLKAIKKGQLYSICPPLTYALIFLRDTIGTIISIPILLLWSLVKLFKGICIFLEILWFLKISPLLICAGGFFAAILIGIKEYADTVKCSFKEAFGICIDIYIKRFHEQMPEIIESFKKTPVTHALLILLLLAIATVIAFGIHCLTRLSLREEYESNDNQNPFEAIGDIMDEIRSRKRHDEDDIYHNSVIPHPKTSFEKVTECIKMYQRYLKLPESYKKGLKDAADEKKRYEEEKKARDAHREASRKEFEYAHACVFGFISMNYEEVIDSSPTFFPSGYLSFISQKESENAARFKSRYRDFCKSLVKNYIVEKCSEPLYWSRDGYYIHPDVPKHILELGIGDASLLASFLAYQFGEANMIRNFPIIWDSAADVRNEYKKLQNDCIDQITEYIYEYVSSHPGRNLVTDGGNNNPAAPDPDYAHKLAYKTFCKFLRKTYIKRKHPVLTKEDCRDAVLNYYNEVDAFYSRMHDIGDSLTDDPYQLYYDYMGLKIWEKEQESLKKSKKHKKEQ